MGLTFEMIKKSELVINGTLKLNAPLPVIQKKICQMPFYADLAKNHGDLENMKRFLVREIS